jgi:hypothetical protein
VMKSVSVIWKNGPPLVIPTGAYPDFLTRAASHVDPQRHGSPQEIRGSAVEGLAVPRYSHAPSQEAKFIFRNRKGRPLISLITHISHIFSGHPELLTGSLFLAPGFLAPADTREGNRASTNLHGSGSTP